MKVVIAACLMAVVTARCSTDEPMCDMSYFAEIDAKIAQSFRFEEDGLKFAFTECRWIKVTPPPAIIKMLERANGTMVPTDLCWNPDAHIATYKHVFELLHGCDRS